MQPNATAVASPEIDVTSGQSVAYDAKPATECNQNPNSALFTLSAQQEAALELLLRGIPTPKIAQYLNIHRVTVHRWKTSHPRFIAELAHRARSSQFESAIRARKTIDLANRIVLKQLVHNPKSSSDLAAKLLASPRLARLASLDDLASPDFLNQLHSMRHSPDDADPAFLRELADEINAPISADQSNPAALAASIPTGQRRYAHRQPRQCLLDAMAFYKVPDNEISQAIARRPDLHPLDIHYSLNRDDYIPRPPMPFLTDLLRDGPVGITTPLNAHFIGWSLVYVQKVRHVAGYSMEDYECMADHQTNGLRFTHKQDKSTIHLPADQLWRDIVIPQ